MLEPTIVSFDGIRYEFGMDGFPAKVTLEGFNGRLINAAGKNFSRINLRLTDGRTLIPFSKSAPRRTDLKKEIILDYPEILWKDDAGNVVEDFRLSMSYHLLTRGRAYVNAFFVANNMHTPEVDDFSIKFDFDTSEAGEAHWAAVRRAKVFQAADIQQFRTGRYVPRGEGRRTEGTIHTNISLNLRDLHGESAYMEAFVEAENALSLDNDDCATDVSWTDDGIMQNSFEFVRVKPCRNKPMQLFQWSNTFGWIVKLADRTRKKPPLHMHHYFDNYLRYPTDECLENLAASGTDVLVIHENWRLNIQNDGVPFQPQELQRVVEKAHSLGIRIALYMRGNEVSAVDDACGWFDRWLKKDFDGLYMDYGGPFHPGEPDEMYPGGRLAFQNYLRRMERLRERVGEDGIFYGHSGAQFSAIWYACEGSDGYVSGEGEGGVMVSSRSAHEYYSMSAAGCGTMWIGAFPAYSTGKMRPFVAATGQYPHSSLGEQFRTSSLAHPREPGVNDKAFKPIWKLWRFFRNERNVTVLNDYNSSGVFSASPDTGHYLMVSKDQKRAILIVSNFADNAQRITCTLNKDLCGFDLAGKKMYQLMPTETAPGKAVEVNGNTYEFELGKWDVGAILFETEDCSAAIADFEKPYPAYTAENMRYLNYLAEQKKLRYEPEPQKEIWLSLTVPNTNLSYEFSMIYDLYYNAMALVEFDAEGNRKRLGWISQKGFVLDEPPAEDYIWPDVISPRVPLHEILGKGEHFIGIESVHYGGPFYSFLSAELSRSKDGEGAYNIYFLNELEPERQFLRWKVIVD